MFELFNPLQIVTSHFSTIRDFGRQKINLFAMLLYLLLPTAGAGAMVWARIALSENTVNILITSMSIFAGLLFNLLLLVYDIIHRPADEQDADEDHQALRKAFLKEIFSNISFAVLMSTLIVLTLVVWSLVPQWRLSLVFAAIAYYLIGMFLLTLMMVLKRVHTLLTV